MPRATLARLMRQWMWFGAGRRPVRVFSYAFRLACPVVIDLPMYMLRASNRPRLRHATCLLPLSLPVPLYSLSAARSFGRVPFSPAVPRIPISFPRSPPASRLRQSHPPSRSRGPPPLPARPLHIFPVQSEQAFSYFVDPMSPILSSSATLLYLVVHHVGRVLYRLRMVRYRSGLLSRVTPGYDRVRTVLSGFHPGKPRDDRAQVCPHHPTCAAVRCRPALTARGSPADRRGRW